MGNGRSLVAVPEQWNFHRRSCQDLTRSHSAVRRTSVSLRWAAHRAAGVVALFVGDSETFVYDARCPVAGWSWLGERHASVSVADIAGSVMPSGLLESGGSGCADLSQFSCQRSGKWLEFCHQLFGDCSYRFDRLVETSTDDARTGVVRAAVSQNRRDQPVLWKLALMSSGEWLLPS